MYENPNRLVADRLADGDQGINVLQLSRELQARIKEATGLEARPTISSSRPLGPPRMDRDEYTPFYIVPPKYHGVRRALLIGVVNGEGDNLKGTPNDITNVKHFLQKHCDFEPENITVLQDYYKHSKAAQKSTKQNILKGFEKLVSEAKPGDVCFIQFSGHGGRAGSNLCLLPTDYDTAGFISDEIILRELIKKMPADVYTTMLVDACYSGTVGDLPYVLQAGASKQSIDSYYDTNTRTEMLRKEREDSEAYEQCIKARSERRVMNRLATAITAGFEAAAGTGMEAGTVVTETIGKTGTTALKAIGRTGKEAAKGASSASAAGLTAIKQVGHTGAAAAKSFGKRSSDMASSAVCKSSAAATSIGKPAALFAHKIGKTAKKKMRLML